MKSDNNMRTNNHERQKKNGSYTRNAGNNTRKQTAKQKNNKYRPKQRSTGKYAEKAALKNNMPKTAGKGAVKAGSGRRGRRNTEKLKIIPLGGLE